MDVIDTDLASFAATQQQRFDSTTSAAERRDRGHFGTPPAIAQFMAGMFTGRPFAKLRVLDAGAGVGTLSAAVCQRALSEPVCASLSIELWENDPKLHAILEATMRHCQTVLRARDVPMSFVVRAGDFILEHSQRSLFTSGPAPEFDWAILNPPYFKVRRDSLHARTMKHVVHGQPNIYSLFMAVAADLLVPGGELVAITPRSYFNGPYFAKFRRWFFDRLSVRQIHIFESRSEAFKDDAVLQENVVLHAERDGERGDVLLTSNPGRDLELIDRHSATYESVIDDRDGDRIVRVTTSDTESELVAAIDRLPCRLRDLGLEISTGPVVTFRATEFLRQDRSHDTAPLLWMHNIRPFITRFPNSPAKPTHIAVCKSSRKLLLPADNYVLLKRFTAKEEKRRLVAGIMTRSDSYSEWVGLENHINYVYRPGASLDDTEVFGLAAFFNSVFVDGYFRAISGNTQVNATEIRCLPMPDSRTLREIGVQVRGLDARDSGQVGEIVGRALQLENSLIARLIESDT